MLKYEPKNRNSQKIEGRSNFGLETPRLDKEENERSGTIEANALSTQQRRAKDALQFAADKLGLFRLRAVLEVPDLPKS